MLNNGFYNLAEPKHGTVVRVDRSYGGICVDLTDNHGDQLQVVLSPKTLAEVIAKSLVFLKKGKVSK